MHVNDIINYHQLQQTLIQEAISLVYPMCFSSPTHLSILKNYHGRKYEFVEDIKNCCKSGRKYFSFIPSSILSESHGEYRTELSQSNV